jgi:hypothetical protein
MRVWSDSRQRDAAALAQFKEEQERARELDIDGMVETAFAEVEI